MKSLFFTLVVAMISTNVFAENAPTMSCLFENFIGVSHEIPEKSKKSLIHQSMKIVQGKTDIQTLKMDGSLRATNSKLWKNMTLDGWETWETIYFGDSQEILSLSHELGANKKPLHGWYKASLVNARVDSTSIFLGNCVVE